ncbi:hypothetical protein QTP88_011517 [Uroleucon formosanum]
MADPRNTKRLDAAYATLTDSFTPDDRVFVCRAAADLTMSVKIVAPARCEVRAVIRFFCAKGSSAAKIYRELSLVYGPGVMCEGKVRQWCRDFKNGRTNVHVEERSGRPSVQTDEIVSLVDQKLRSDRRLMISAVTDELRRAIQNRRRDKLSSGYNPPS